MKSSSQGLNTLYRQWKFSSLISSLNSRRFWLRRKDKSRISCFTILRIKALVVKEILITAQSGIRIIRLPNGTGGRHFMLNRKSMSTPIGLEWPFEADWRGR